MSDDKSTPESGAPDKASPTPPKATAAAAATPEPPKAETAAAADSTAAPDAGTPEASAKRSWWKSAKVWWPTAAALAVLGAAYGIFTMISWIGHWQDEADRLEATASDKGEAIVATEFKIAELALLTDLVTDQGEVAADQAEDATSEAEDAQQTTNELRAALDQLVQCSIDTQKLSDAYYKGTTSSRNKEREALQEECNEAWKRVKAASRG